MNTHTRARAHARTRIQMHTRTHARTHERTHARTHTHTKGMHACTHTFAHTHTHKHRVVYHFFLTCQGNGKVSESFHTIYFEYHRASARHLGCMNVLAYVRVYSGPVSMRHRSGEMNYLYGYRYNCIYFFFPFFFLLSFFSFFFFLSSFFLSCCCFVFDNLKNNNSCYYFLCNLLTYAVNMIIVRSV